LFVAFAEAGVDRIFPWPGDRPWNFVLHDGVSSRVDLYLYEPLADGSPHYGSVVDGGAFPSEALAGHGVIAGTEVRCESAEAVRWHTGYPARDVDRHDVPLLCQSFGIAVPEGFEPLSAEGRQHSSDVNGQWLTALQGSVTLGIDGVGQQRHVAEGLVGISAVGQQPGQSLRIVVLDRVMGGCPVVTHQGIQPPSQPVCQRLSPLAITN
jgi:hypothetical protein